MIVEVRDDTLALSGQLRRNYWQTLAPSARVLLQRHPEGLILDCSGVSYLSHEGTETLRHAEAFVSEHGGQLVVAELQAEVARTLRSIPNLGSRLALAESVSQARTTLGMKPSTPQETVIRCAVALLGTEADDHAISLAARLTEAQGTVFLLFPLQVPRDRSLLSSLGAEEEEARTRLEHFGEMLRAQHIHVIARVERTRDRARRVVDVLEEFPAQRLVVAVKQEVDEGTLRTARQIAHQASCPTLFLHLNREEKR